MVLESDGTRRGTELNGYSFSAESLPSVPVPRGHVRKESLT
jgi:hypothetical protein